MKKSSEKRKVLNLREFLNDNEVDLNVNFRVCNIRKKQKYEDDINQNKNHIEKMINFRSNINLDYDLIKARRDLLRCDFVDFMKTMDSNLVLNNKYKQIITEKNKKIITNAILKRLEVEACNKDNDHHHKNCYCFHYKNEEIPHQHKNSIFKSMRKSQSSLNFNETLKETTIRYNAGSSTAASFDKLLRKSTNESNFVFSDSLKVSPEKEKFIEKRKDFTKKKELIKRISILLPSLKIPDIKLDQLNQGNVGFKLEKEEHYINYGEDNEIYKKRLILPQEESPQSQKKTLLKETKSFKNKSLIFDCNYVNDKKFILPKEDSPKFNKKNNYEQRKTIIIGSILNDDYDIEKKELQKSLPIKLKKWSSMTSFYNADYRGKDQQVKVHSSKTSMNQFNPKSVIIIEKNKTIDPSEQWKKQRKNEVKKNIAKEFVRLKSVKNQIHKTFDSALAELYEKAINKRKRTGDSNPSQN